MSTLLNSEWYDESGKYVPLSDRDISDNDIFSQIFKDMEGIADYTQIGGYLHIHTNRDPQEVKDELVENHGGIVASVEKEYEKGYSIANSDRVTVITFSAK